MIYREGYRGKMEIKLFITGKLNNKIYIEMIDDRINTNYRTRKQ